MPALVNISVGSLRGTSGDEGTMVVAVLGEKIEEARADFVDAVHGICVSYLARWACAAPANRALSDAACAGGRIP